MWERTGYAMRTSVLAVAFLLTDSVVCQADDLKMGSIFTDHMILQREQPVAIWGTSVPGDSLTVEFAGQSVKGISDVQGYWLVRLEPLAASRDSRTLIVKSQKSSAANRTIELKDVLVGEVWLASGQSNMEWEMQMKEDSKADIPTAQHPDLRLYAVPLTTSLIPQSSTAAVWERCTPETVTTFSAVGYYFGLRLKEELGVPVGVIQSAWGGTRIEPWSTLSGYDGVPSLAAEAATLRSKLPGTEQYQATHQEHIGATENWLAAAKAAINAGAAVPPVPAQPETLQSGAGTPTAIYNAMIHPLVPYGIRGAIWYQGESNHGEGLHYVDRTDALLKSWRGAFQQKVPFYFVQIAPYQYGDEDPEILARFWVAQRECLKLPNTGMAVITDIAEIGDIHPAKKKEVARRLSLWALADAYGRKDIDPSGPLYQSFEIDGPRVRVTFEHAESGLKSLDGNPLTHFEIAGVDGQFHAAVAEIDGKSVIVSSSEVPKPRQVRFGWHKAAMPNLVDQDGLPACAFHTHWPVELDLGKNVAAGCSWESSDPNIYGWDTGLTDGNWGTRAPQCFATGVTVKFPKHVVIDLKSTQTINLIRAGVPEIGSTKTIEFAVSSDGESYETVGTRTFALGKEQRAAVEFEPKSARFIRMTYLDYHEKESGGFPVFFAFTTEVEAFHVKSSEVAR